MFKFAILLRTQQYIALTKHAQQMAKQGMISLIIWKYSITDKDFILSLAI
jgi:hypothetical protein